jgi:hypothetical protein
VKYRKSNRRVVRRRQRKPTRKIVRRVRRRRGGFPIRDGLRFIIRNRMKSRRQLVQGEKMNN